MKPTIVLFCACLSASFVLSCSSGGSDSGAGINDSGIRVAQGRDAGNDAANTDSALRADSGRDNVGSHDAGSDASIVGDASSHDVGDAGTITLGSSCKRGIAYGHHSKEDLAALQPAISWWYNWATMPDQDLRDGSYRTANVEYVPMIWGGTFDVNTAINEIPNDASWLLGFNEPNFGAQSNLSAIDAAALWPDVESIADALGLSLVSPAPNFCGGSCQDTDPFNYLDDFFAACDGCRIDAVAFHVYVGCNATGGNKAQWLIDHVNTYKQRFSQPLWLTEFACTDAASFDDQIAFLNDAVEFLESDSRIERYAWFSGRFDGIPFVDVLGDNGKLTPLGQAYLDAPAATSCTR